MIVDRAVIQFARTGEGELGHQPPHHILRTGLYNALVAIDEKGGTLCVLQIFRHRSVK